jgi:hypothetical protein
LNPSEVIPGAGEGKISSDAEIRKRMMRFNNNGGGNEMLNPE